MECETTRNFTSAVDGLVRDRLRLPAGEATVTGEHNQISAMFKSMECVLSEGTYEESKWWECMNHVLQLMVEEGDGLPPGLHSHLGDNIQSARSWLLQGVELINSLEEFIVRCFSMEDVVSAYYVPTSPLGSADTRERILRAFTKLTSLTFQLRPSDIRLFTCAELQLLPAPTSPRGSSSPVIVKKKTVRTTRTKKLKTLKSKDEGQSSPLPTPPPTDILSPRVKEVVLPPPDHTEYIMVADDFAQTREASRREVESRHVVVQRNEMRLVQAQLDLKSHEQRVKNIEEQNAQGQACSETLLTVKEIIFALKEFSQIHNSTNVTLSELSVRIPSIINAITQKVVPVAVQAPLSPRAMSSVVLGKAFSSHIDGNRETRARSCAFSPTKYAQVITGQGIDALENVQDDFFKVDSDDEQGIAVSQFRGSFRPGSWVTFEGLSVDELGSVKREVQLTLQSYQCQGCKCAISASKNPIRRARLCHYSGKYYCRSCHKKKTHVLPSLIINRWDFSAKQVCDSANWHLRKEYKSALLNLSELKSNLYSKLDCMQSSRRYRTAIVLVAELLPSQSRELVGELSTYGYYLSSIHTYSLEDLVSLHDSEDKYLQHLKSILSIVVMKAEKIDASKARDAMARAGVSL